MWLLFALLSPVFWAIVHVLDSHCVERVFNRPWIGVITSSLASVVVLLIIPFALPFVDWTVPEGKIILLALVTGALIQLSQIFYFQALEYSEAGIVAAYWNLVPALMPMISFVCFRKILGGWQYLGIGILALASVCFCLLDTQVVRPRMAAQAGQKYSSTLMFAGEASAFTPWEDDFAPLSHPPTANSQPAFSLQLNWQPHWRTFGLMVVASCLQVQALFLEEQVYHHSSFFVGFLLVTLGVILSGALPLLLTGVREVFRQNLSALKPAIPMIIGIEVANLIALFMSQRAISLGIPSLVAAVEASVPAYTFGLSIVLLLLYSPLGDRQVWHQFPFKLGLAVVMAFGVRMVS